MQKKIKIKSLAVLVEFKIHDLPYVIIVKVSRACIIPVYKESNHKMKVL